MLVAEAVCKGVTEDEMNRLIHDMYQEIRQKVITGGIMNRLPFTKYASKH